MNRRHVFAAAAGGMVAAAQAPFLPARATHSSSEPLFKTINLQADGLALTPNQMFDPSTLEQVSAYAREHGIRLHLDGARMFSLPYHSARSLQAYASLFDAVYVSLWKHFNGASGAILAADESFIRGLFHTRRMFGGSLPQAWPQLALVGPSADTFQDDYARAWKSAQEFLHLLKSDERFEAVQLPNGTSRFFLNVATPAPQEFVERLSQKGVVLSHPQTG